MRITEQTLYAVDFDLWGLSGGWVQTICDALYEIVGEDDSAEDYDVPMAGVESFHFVSPSPSQIRKAKAVFAQYYNLAKKTDLGINHNR